MVFVDGWMDGWMDGWTSRMERMVVEGDRELRRVSQMTRIGYLLHHSKSGRFQSPIVVASFTKVQISAVRVPLTMNSLNDVFQFLTMRHVPRR